MIDLQLQQTREEAKTHDGAKSLEVSMEAANLFFDHPLGSLEHLLGVSRSTIKRIRKRLAALRGGPRTRSKNPQKQGSKNPSSGVEAGNPELSPSSLYFPPPPKGGVPPRGIQNSGPVTAKKQTTKTKTPCPADWQPRPEDRAYVEALGLDPDRLRDTMVDWSAEDPIRNRKTSWDATYRNWGRRDGERRAAEKARLEGQRQNYLQARQDAAEGPLDREATRRARESREGRQAALAIARRYNGGEL